MAGRHSTRQRRGRTTSRSAKIHAREGSQDLPADVETAALSALGAHRDLMNELKSITWRLSAAYCACVTVQAALEKQMADQDGDFARCLQNGVADPVSSQVERLHTILNRLRTKISPLSVA